MAKFKTTLPLNNAELAAWEASRDIGVELLESIGQMLRGETSVIHKVSQPAQQIEHTETAGIFADAKISTRKMT
ncbi:hypothetical protein [Rhodoferax sp.]|uniref:hypothetical protein n=1 Tax=Rhodoferax sp. TaxID=50421 RepID=UPI00374DF3D7